VVLSLLETLLVLVRAAARRTVVQLRSPADV